MTPESRQPEQEIVTAGVPGVQTPSHPTWVQRVSALLLIVFCLDLGLFLLIYPWTDSWAGNYFSWIGPMRWQPTWHQIWTNGFTRGAVSGVGLLNIWIAVAEALRMYIGSGHHES
jgi:hypothetical protein